MPADTLFLGGTSIDLIHDRQKGRVGDRHACPLLFTTYVGGSVTNSAVISAKLGLKTALLSKIGRDALGDFACEFLDSCGIDIKGIIQDTNIHTTLAIDKIDKFGVAKYTFYKNSPKESLVPIKTTPKHLLNTCKVFHTGSSYSYQKETFEETLKFIKYLKKRNAFISYDPNIRPEGITDKFIVKNRVLRLLNLSDLAKLSEVDIKYLTGQKNPEKGLKTLKKLVKCEIILTLGSKGSIYSHAHLGGGLWPTARWAWVKIPAFKVKVVDTIGAGDAFTAGLIDQLIKQGRAKFFANMRANMIFASAVSAIICTKKGSHEALKNLKQVNSFLTKHHAG